MDEAVYTCLRAVFIFCRTSFYQDTALLVGHQTSMYISNEINKTKSYGIKFTKRFDFLTTFRDYKAIPGE